MPEPASLPPLRLYPYACTRARPVARTRRSRAAHRILHAILWVPLLVLAPGRDHLLAYCVSSIETYAIFQCAHRGYFAPVPPPHTPSSVKGVFWQIGFGNGTVNTGLGSDGTGFSSSVFNGNDSGTFPVNFLDAAATFPAVGFPPDSICLGSNNWANSGIDGCCDNPRPAAPFAYTNAYSGLGPYSYPSDDNVLNPYFGTFQSAQGFPGYFSLASIMDYPTAVLAKTPGDEYFAIAAVTIMSRGNNGVTTRTDCSSASPANPAACDMRQGEWSLGTVTNGLPNAIPGEADKRNVVPWQRPPVAVVGSTTAAAGGDPAGAVSVDLSWPAVGINHDGRSVPSNNPTLATRNPGQPRDPSAAPGVGVVDLLGRFGLVMYQIQVAARADLDFKSISRTVDCPGDPACSSPTSATLTLGPSQCVRIRTLFGTRPRTMTYGSPACRLGRCGDVGYGVNGSRTCIDSCTPDPGGETCNGFDDDCDDQVDEDFPIGRDCEGIGECGPGTLECSFTNPRATQCSTEPGGWQDQSESEICDGLDNDCSGVTDGFPVACGLGACASTGICNGGLDSCTPGAPSDEVCDTLDNDCDGRTDEDFALGEDCEAVGVCGKGLTECVPGSVNLICSTAPGGTEDRSSEEICDDLDNDCDATTDEGFVLGEPCEGMGVCGAGVTECTPETVGAICSTAPGGSADQSSPEICDGLDNDCEGSKDAFPTKCGQGACARSGLCTAGKDSCLPGQPAAETCDALDHDCDGVPSNPTKKDQDNDRVDDGCDNCPAHSNPGQEDGDGDGMGNACEPPVVMLSYM